MPARPNSRAPPEKEIRHGFNGCNRFARPPSTLADDEVSLVRLYVLRATYLLLVVGLGAMIVPDIVSHRLIDRGSHPEPAGAASGCSPSSACATRCRCCRC